jgi:hypothetical protein
MTPVICDPAPPPTFVPSLQHFRVLSSSTENNPQVTIATIRGHVLAPNGIPYRDVEVTARSVDQTITVKTDGTGLYTIHLGTVGPYSVFVQQDEENLLQIDVKEHDVLLIDWVSVPQPPSSQAKTLPLAEIRSVKISHIGGSTFRADTPWPNARFQWMVSQGTVERNGGEVTWSFSTSPGRHLLQVIADWGAEGIAVDALTLIVQDDGTTELA